MIHQGEFDQKFIKNVVDRQFSRAMLYSIFNPSEWPTISKFAREKKRDPNLNNSNILATDHTHLHMVRSLLWVWHRINMVQ